MDVFLETERLVLRRFSDADLDLLVELDGDPEVMRYITGGRPTSREELRDEVLPAFLGYYRRFPGYGFWAAVERTGGQFLGGSTCGRPRAPPRTSPSSATGCAGRPGARATPPRGRGP